MENNLSLHKVSLQQQELSTHYIMFIHITLCLCAFQQDKGRQKKLEKTTFIKNKNYSDVCCLYLIKINKTKKLEAPVNEASRAERRR